MGLSPKQVKRLTNRVLLALDYIGSKGRRVSIEVFDCFQGELRPKGQRMRFNLLLEKAKLIKRSKPALQGFCSAEYVCLGDSVLQSIKLNKKEAAISRRILAVMRKKARNDDTLAWLNKSAPHCFSEGAYMYTERLPEWPAIDLRRTYAGIVLEARRKAFRERYLRSLREDNYLLLDNGSEGRTIRQSELEVHFEQISKLAKFADSLRGKPCSADNLIAICFRVERMIKKQGFETLRLRFIKEIVEKVVSQLKAKKVFCAVDGFKIYAEHAESLEVALIVACKESLGVDLTLRDAPILTPLYIDHLRRLYALKHGVDIKHAPRARAKHWQPIGLFSEKGKPIPQKRIFREGEQLLGTVQEANEFYGIDPELEAASRLTLQDARMQISSDGVIRASNSEPLYAELEDLGHAIPVDPTRQEWELTPKGMQFMLKCSPVFPASRGAKKEKQGLMPVNKRDAA